MFMYDNDQHSRLSGRGGWIGPRGFTLLEMTFAVAIFTVVMGILFSLSTGMGTTARIQQAKATAGDESRRAMLYMARDLRQAVRRTIAGAPGSTLTFQMPEDTDGNGTAVDINGRLEMGLARTIGRDTEDVNGDGETGDQLIWTNGDQAFVLANNLCENEDVNENGVLDEGEDKNGNGTLDRGIWFEFVDNRLVISIQTRGSRNPAEIITSNLVQMVFPRNG